ncbi:fucose permease [Propionicimonas paludicola]|uniref:Fucose permease n=1 Tax=Propionicimonas paludicola TaxID=185243 RepID=A0A2A9CV00_9ACTN|nr:MFS transporter [Propionicimonas paludicola]PFG17399.1 fucose permease [Propionicimonas paludicola]
MNSLTSGKAAAAVVSLFAYNGLVIGAYAASIPTLKARFDLSAQFLSVFFITMGLSAIASMQVVGRLSDRFGARRISLAMIPLQAIGVALIGWSPSLPVMFAGGVILGLGNGGVDVAMNAVGVQVEKQRPRPIMSFFHGTWSIGNFLGAGLLVVLSPLLAGQADPTVHAATAIAAAVGIPALIVGWMIVPETAPVSHETADGPKTKLPPVVWLFGLMAIAFGIGEGTAMDWSGLHVATVTGADAGTAALGVTMLAGAMVIIRLLGDFLVARFGRRAVTRFGGACSATGYLIAALATPLPVVLLGWGLVGLGIGMIAPQVYASAGHLAGGRGLAVVVTFGYATFLIAPAIMGALVGGIGVQHTMFVPAVLLLGLLFLARILPGREFDHAAEVAEPVSS